jgi:hypothetical protein|tara:strand:+ start:867 stop:1619 length:753 start_codon:yes stop_codon:yes gene_type:complete
MPESTDTDYTHLDMTPEYNRIITALTGIRDDVRLLQKLQSDPESGIATSNVLNDFQRALLAVSMSSAVGNTAAAVSEAVIAGTLPNGAAVAAASGESNADLTAERTTIIAALGATEDPADLKVLIRVSGQYYWEAKGTAGPDDGLRGSNIIVTPFVLGEQLGYDDEATGVITAGAPPGPPDGIPNASAPKKRWPFARPEGQTASPLANPNADLIDPATGLIVSQSAATQDTNNAAGTTAPPATDYSAGAS